MILFKKVLQMQNNLIKKIKNMRGRWILPFVFLEERRILKNKTLSFLIAAAFIINCTACSGSTLTRYEAQFLVLFDTLTTIVGYEESKEAFTQYAMIIYDSLEEYHQLYDIYHDYEGINNIKTINDNAGKAPVKVDRRIIDLLLFAKEEYHLTGREINVAFGAVLKIWHDYRTRGIDDPEGAEAPPIELLRAASGHTDINQVMIDETASTVFLTDPEMSLDVGAIAKGYAVEQTAQIAIRNGFDSGIISVGGNVRAIGKKNAALWNIGIQNPDGESDQKNLMVAYISDLSLVTSGNYERYYTVGDKKYHHIISPETLFPSGYFTAVTIVCKDSGVADVLSTAIFNMPFDQGFQYIENLPDTEALWVLKDGEIKFSTGFEKYIKN